MADARNTTADFDQLAEWLSDHLMGDPFRVTVVPLLPAADGRLMAGPTALDIYLPAPFDGAAILEAATDGLPERYLSLPYAGGHLVITEAEFDHASLVNERRGEILVYMVGSVGVCLARQPAAGEGES
jgi:hypothetical protein